MRVRTGFSLSTAIVAGVMAIGTARVNATINDDWAVFHHDAQHSGVSPDTTVGAAHAPSLTKKWSATIGGGPAPGSPVVALNSTLSEEVVYTMSAGGTVHAFNASSGASVWTATIGSGVASPALDAANNTLYIGDNAGTMTALNATTGAVACTFQLQVFAPETTPGRIQEAPVIDAAGSGGPIVYFGDVGQKETVNAGRFYAMYGVGNTHTPCTQRWMHRLGKTGSQVGGTWSPPTLGTDKNGRQLVIFGTSQPLDTVVALNTTTGALAWTFKTAKTFADADVGAGPAVSAPTVNGVADGAVYVDGKDGIEYAIDLTTGASAPLWSFNLQANAGKPLNSVSCAAVAGSDVIVAFSTYVFAFDAATGALVWRSAPTSASILASVAVSGGAGDQVVLIDDLSGHLYAFRVSSGAMLLNTTVDAGKAFDASPAVADGMVFLAGTDGLVYAFG